MSYGITPIAVSLDKVESVIGGDTRSSGLFGRLFGSSNSSLIKKIKHQAVDGQFANGQLPLIFGAALMIVAGLRFVCSGFVCSSNVLFAGPGRSGCDIENAILIT